MSAVVYNPYHYDIHEDPYPTYARLRDEAPLYHNAELGFWALSRHADVMGGFRDATRLSSADGVSLDPSATGPQAQKAMSFLAMDPPRHGQMRALVAKGFTPRRVMDLEPRIRELTVEHLEPALDAGTFDLVGDFAAKLPMDVISELLGVPNDDRNEVRRLADLLVHREDGVLGVPAVGVEAALVLAGYFSELIGQRQRSPSADLISALLQAEIDGYRITEDELIGFLFLMVVAGNETTAKLVANAWYWAWRNPDQRQKVLSDPDRVPDWVEETVRYDTSSQMLARTAREDIEVHGGRIPAGARVLLLAGSANRDPRAFPDPDRYDLDRVGGDLASFGMGHHYCMGASLARLEASIALGELRARVADYDIDPDGTRRVHSANVRGFAALPTTVKAR